ncbi:MAG TPA: hypothetical protein VGD91_21240 [Trebonia sp.]
MQITVSGSPILPEHYSNARCLLCGFLAPARTPENQDLDYTTPLSEHAALRHPGVRHLRRGQEWDFVA